MNSQHQKVWINIVTGTDLLPKKDSRWWVFIDDQAFFEGIENSTFLAVNWMEYHGSNHHELIISIWKRDVRISTRCIVFYQRNAHHLFAFNFVRET